MQVNITEQFAFAAGWKKLRKENGNDMCACREFFNEYYFVIHLLCIVKSLITWVLGYKTFCILFLVSGGGGWINSS